MRDLDTAQIANRAALTGHLVLSTLHTNDAPSTVTRLVDMGIPPFLLASSLRLVVAQRLARKVCEDCREPYEVDEGDLIVHGLVPQGRGAVTLYRGRGCQVCNVTGLKGRIALYEVMPITREIRDLIVSGASTEAIKKVACDLGMRTLREAGLVKVLEGVTTIEEVLARHRRVISERARDRRRPHPSPAPLPRCRFRFPDPARADAEGLLAEGGDLEPSTLIDAYRRGIFPWPVEEHELLWWSPDPRAILPLDGLHVSRSLARTLRQARFRITLNAAFADVIAACADREETWITPTLRAAYVRLHRAGWAHSVEVWTPAGALAGGLYGVAVGALFSAESMFHRAPDASKVALVALVDHARGRTTLLDVQVPSPHLTSLGARTIRRRDYLARVAAAIAQPVAFAG